MVEAEGNCPPRPKIRPDEDTTSLVYESRFMPFLWSQTINGFLNLIFIFLPNSIKFRKMHLPSLVPHSDNSVSQYLSREVNHSLSGYYAAKIATSLLVATVCTSNSLALIFCIGFDKVLCILDLHFKILFLRQS